MLHRLGFVVKDGVGDVDVHGFLLKPLIPLLAC
jgi:hypothetical protein